MRRRNFSACALTGLFAAHANGQEASVAELTRADSTKASELYKRLKAAEADWADFTTAIKEKYGPIAAKDLPDRLRARFFKPDGTEVVMPAFWTQGIEFSSDFRFVTQRRP